MGVCTVCYERPRNCFIRPCGHLTVCMQCMQVSFHLYTLPLFYLNHILMKQKRSLMSISLATNFSKAFVSFMLTLPKMYTYPVYCRLCCTYLYFQKNITEMFTIVFFLLLKCDYISSINRFVKRSGLLCVFQAKGGVIFCLPL